LLPCFHPDLQGDFFPKTPSRGQEYPRQADVVVGGKDQIKVGQEVANNHGGKNRKATNSKRYTPALKLLHESGAIVMRPVQDGNVAIGRAFGHEPLYFSGNPIRLAHIVRAAKQINRAAFFTLRPQLRLGWISVLIPLDDHIRDAQHAFRGAVIAIQEDGFVSWEYLPKHVEGAV